MQGLATEAGVTVGLTKPRFELVARPVEVVGLMKVVNVPFPSSSQRQLRHLCEDHLPASMQHEVREGNPRAGGTEGARRQRKRRSRQQGWGGIL